LDQVFLGGLAGLALGAGIGACCNIFARCIGLFACQLEGGIWISAKADRFALAVYRVIESPGSTTTLDRQQQIQTTTVIESSFAVDQGCVRFQSSKRCI